MINFNMVRINITNFHDNIVCNINTYSYIPSNTFKHLCLFQHLAQSHCFFISIFVRSILLFTTVKKLKETIPRHKCFQCLNLFMYINTLLTLHLGNNYQSYLHVSIEPTSQDSANQQSNYLTIHRNIEKFCKGCSATCLLRTVQH